ncbi:hypothetical protein MGN70_005628 [Eutypa lata]|uniref:Putative gpi anchored protein n=1 Tax=Eutypa lata (strain UCR-EL1) TaxID=1287681 RepID=M7TIX4_EUTLA|nr:putative gpi anchored protein [Eutypa lata UCREL1]KAI1253420.1 hypothetical protein MGN70_005628 [Eutypa lata]
MVNVKAVSTGAVILAGLLGDVLAHPGETHDTEKRRRDLEQNNVAIQHAKRTVAQCSGSETGQKLAKKGAARRAAKAQELREKRGLEYSGMKTKRDQAALDEWMKVCHNREELEYDLSTPFETIFSSNATLGLAPETIIGPYWVTGEAIRSDITEDEAGIPVHLDLQFIDISDCSPVPDMLIDLWHANAIGNYSGVSMGSGLNTTFLRGVQVTDEQGVVEFDTLFPGHYTGRVNHIHVTSNRGGELLENGTYTAGTGTVNHIGQIYFDQELINWIETFNPYIDNEMKLTINMQDFLAAQQAGQEYDPFLDYVMLSEDPADGLLMWMTLGINGTADYNRAATPGAHYYEGGGVDAGPQFPGFPGNFTMPPGGFPMPPAPTPTSKPIWGPCMKKRDMEDEDE